MIEFDVTFATDSTDAAQTLLEVIGTGLQGALRLIALHDVGIVTEVISDPEAVSFNEHQRQPTCKTHIYMYPCTSFIT